MAGLSGGCLCGAVRYRLASDPFDCGWCHCRICQLSSGSPAMAFASVNEGDFAWTAGAGEVRTVKSSSFGHRAFCGRCGTPLYMKVDHQPETIDFSTVTLDHPEANAPEFHIFWRSKVGWFNPADQLPKFDRFRPDTRGLDGTEPPEG
ncbi:MAG TPA: GFA family protein [Sphingomicrobium sp.]|nr:GFA family protein [Sphingomicrobium sp.]